MHTPMYELRLMGCFITVPSAWLVDRLMAFQARPLPWLIFLLLSQSTMTGWILGGAGAIAYPYLYALPAITVPLIMPLRERLGVCLAVYLSSTAAFLLRRPGNLEGETLAYGSFAFFLAIMMVGVGHIARSMLRDGFMVRRRLADREAELSALGASLQERVDEQTDALRRLLRSIDTAREHERAWLAREVHDDLGQELLGIRLAVDLERQLTPSAGVDRIAALLERCVASFRRVLASMRPQLLDELGLFGAITQLSRSIQGSTGLACSVELTGDSAVVGQEAALALFRAAQEALTNVQKHASARHCWIRVSVAPGSADLLVRDDGVGLPTQVVGPAGLGLLGIRERVRALGGSVRWYNDGGAVMHVVLPLETR
jgi:signal transduction histidine kinase